VQSSYVVFGHQYSSQGHWTLNYYRCIHSDAASVPGRKRRRAAFV